MVGATVPALPLRPSCNECHKSKTKCTYTEAGRCSRCVSLGLRCERSPSQRRGKPKGAKNLSTLRKQRALGHDAVRKDSAPAAPHASPDHAPLPRLPEIKDTPRWQGMDLDPLPSFSCDGAPGDTAVWDLWLDSNHQTLFDWAQGDDSGTAAFPSWGLCATDALSAAPISQWSADLATCEAAALPSIHPSSWVSFPSDATSSSGSSKVCLSHSPATVSLQSPAAASASPAPPTSCLCFANIMHRLQELQQNSVEATPLDMALASNKEALSTLCEALKCSASHDSTCTLILLALVTKVLCSYQETYDIRLDAATTPSSPQSTSRTQAPANSERACATAQDLRELHLKIGMYQLDRDDEMLLKRQVLLLDLRKVASLLRRMETRASSKKDQQGGLTVYQTLAGFLSTKFQVTLNGIQASLPV